MGNRIEVHLKNATDKLKEIANREDCSIPDLVSSYLISIMTCPTTLEVFLEDNNLTVADMFTNAEYNDEEYTWDVMLEK